MSETREFDPDWPQGHETMRGIPARIIARNLRGRQPLAVVLEEEGSDSLETYGEDGTFKFDSSNSSLNLRNRKAAP